MYPLAKYEHAHGAHSRSALFQVACHAVGINLEDWAAHRVQYHYFRGRVLQSNLVQPTAGAAGNIRTVPVGNPEVVLEPLTTLETTATRPIWASKPCAKTQRKNSHGGGDEGAARSIYASHGLPDGSRTFMC